MKFRIIIITQLVLLFLSLSLFGRTLVPAQQQSELNYVSQVIEIPELSESIEIPALPDPPIATVIPKVEKLEAIKEVKEVATPAVDSEVVIFNSLLNSYRATYGRFALVHDPSLDADCATNNDYNNRKHQGGSPKTLKYSFHYRQYYPDLHSYFPNSPYCGQNACYGLSTPEIFKSWQSSVHHNEMLLSTNFRRYGYQFGPGPYATLNLFP